MPVWRDRDAQTKNNLPLFYENFVRTIFDSRGQDHAVSRT